MRQKEAMWLGLGSRLRGVHQVPLWRGTRVRRTAAVQDLGVDGVDVLGIEEGVEAEVSDSEAALDEEMDLERLMMDEDEWDEF